MPNKTKNQRAEFQTWSDLFKKARKRKDFCNVDEAIAAILKLWHTPVPTNSSRTSWRGKSGYRKNSKPSGVGKGEKNVEQRLLGPCGEIKELSLQKGAKQIQIVSIYHNFPFANQKSGQVISDCAGRICVGGRHRPLLMEVKVNANDPWFALVECLQQVRLARVPAGAQCISDMLSERTPKAVCEEEVKEGAWGLVVTDSCSYFTKYPELQEDCKKLLQSLKKETDARIGFAYLIEGNGLKLQWFDGNWS